MTNKINSSKKILIATKNRDKFYIVVNMLKRLGLRDYTFLNLHDLNIHQKLKERGTLLNRAEQKANFYQKIIERKKVVKIVAVLGVDDGIKIEHRKIINSNSKKITDKILSGELVPTGEVIFIMRAFALSLVGNNKRAACVTNIPFVFLGNKMNIKREAEKYPLSRVFGLLNSDKTIIETSSKKCLDYYLKYSQKELSNLCEIIRDYKAIKQGGSSLNF